MLDARTSNLAFARWGDIFSDQIEAATMIDRIVHYAGVLTLKGASCRVHNTGIESLPSIRAENAAQRKQDKWLNFHWRYWLTFQSSLTSGARAAPPMSFALD
ncbi:ATP-binding protein [Cryobacterium sp. PH31-O1]|uniref:ATP-binding protein n=1 Tax=Cryobacterium sp. PH31-O1 TaxID=3046306 RepID=UPI0024BBC9F0|nr:ATP-binding protein [Cryobacterium sp. PH31-O1]MDJ0338688.1 ATP-binding protein [Cryobacterium sp. PH31-O1]